MKRRASSPKVEHFFLGNHTLIRKNWISAEYLLTSLFNLHAKIFLNRIFLHKEEERIFAFPLMLNSFDSSNQRLKHFNNLPVQFSEKSEFV